MKREERVENILAKIWQKLLPKAKSTYRYFGKCLILLVRQERFELPTYGFVVHYYIRINYLI